MRYFHHNLKKIGIYCSWLLLILTACSPQKNTWSSRAYNDVTAHYNAYYYALEEITKIETTIHTSWTDNYNDILMIFPSYDSTLAKTYEAETEEAIKMASLAIQNHGNSRWVDDSYILVGKARMYSLDWGNAIQTFKYVNNIGKDKDAKHLAIINLIRTFTEHEEFNNALAAIDFLKKEDLSKENRKKMYLEAGYYYQIQKDYDNMIRSLTEASPLLDRKDRRSRIYFIIGQVYQELGFESEAYNFYRKCLGTNPEYEVDFYARLYMAQVAEISRSKSIATARKSFRKLLKDSKNKDFKDKIYYELGVFELKQKNINEAIESFDLSLRAGNNQRVKGEAYLRLGEMYYDILKEFELSQSYYDSAIRSLPPEYENYTAIKDRSEVLNEFVLNLKTIEWQDSLLMLSTLDTATLRTKIEASIEARKKLEESGKKKKKNNRIVINAAPSTVFSESTETTDWYFGNPTAVALGETEFKRIWGDRALEDDWRRSQKISGPSLGPMNTTASNDSTALPEKAVVVDPVEAALTSINKEIPRTEEEREASLKKIEDAYFALGDIYYFKLFEKENALSSFETLLNRFPNTVHEPDVLYKLYLIHKESNPQEAERFANLLKEKYPESSYAKILINPNYLAEAVIAIEKQKENYKKAYEDFENNRFKEAMDGIDEALALEKTSFTPNLELLKILIIGKTQSYEHYQASLNQFIESHPDNELIPYAQTLLSASEKVHADEGNQTSVQYIKSFSEPHYFMIVYANKESIGNTASRTLGRFNQTNFPTQKLKTSNLIIDDDYTVSFVAEFDNLEQARNYYQTFNEKVPTLTEFTNQKFFTFIITKDNFGIFYRTKALNEYIRFFEQNYNSKNQ